MCDYICYGILYWVGWKKTTWYGANCFNLSAMGWSFVLNQLYILSKQFTFFQRPVSCKWTLLQDIMRSKRTNRQYNAMPDSVYFQIGILLQFRTIPQGKHVHRKILIESSTNINVFHCIALNSIRNKGAWSIIITNPLLLASHKPINFPLHISHIYYTTVLCSEFRQFSVCWVHQQCIDLHATFFGCISYKNDVIRIFPFPKYFPHLFVTFG